MRKKEKFMKEWLEWSCYHLHEKCDVTKPSNLLIFIVTVYSFSVPHNMDNMDGRLLLLVYISNHICVDPLIRKVT